MAAASERLKQFIAIYWRGMAMGAADVVPGVSGGTIAFITGIYARLVFSLGNLRPQLLRDAFRLLRSQGVLAAGQHIWRTADLFFLLSLLLGIFSSIILLASVVTQALATHPIRLWSFFLGLIVASTLFLVGHLIVDYRRAHPQQRVGMLSLLVWGVIGTTVAWWLTHLPPAPFSQMEPALWWVAACAGVAMCAMILPGISGSFILLLLGMYQPVLEAVSVGDVPVLLAFLAGGALGLLCFVQLLRWLMQHHYLVVMAVMTGFLLGSLNKVWPWKETLSWRVNRSGALLPDWQVNVMPWDYIDVAAANPDVVMALYCMGFGLLAGVVVGVAGLRQ